ncbi:hypothetical protein MOV61_29450, partial [Neorhizobium sp. BETTINA12A]|nr:hypothetical protein [Neorhizobium sp. BETTINA12A]
ASKTVAETYTVNAATKPYKALNTASETTLTEAGTSLTLRKERIFDAYGNLSEIRDFGRKDLAGDETWTLASYTPNTAAYIVSLPMARNIRSGGFSTSTDVFEQHQTLYYDGSTDITAPPTKGNLTMLGSFKSFEPTQTSYNELFTYDTYGNKLSHVDGEGSRTEWDYDPDYHLHVVAERAPKYFATGGQPADARFVSTFTNDYVCGKPARKVDWNGVTETFTYDPFCRPYGYTHWGTGKYVNTRYENEGNPASQAVVSYEPLATGTGDVFTRTFYDGLGRPWRVQTPGETASGQTRITDTSYDARGNVWQTAFARFADETAQWTVNSYDWQDRVVKTVNPDASQRTYTYLVQPTAITGTSNLPVMEVRMTDEESKLRRTVMDKDNNVILKATQLAGAWVAEAQTYDVVGRLKGVRDDGGATWTYTYDLLGNRLSASDPDLGTWSYAYDNANRLVSQTDARGAVTTLSYDQMGRLLTKQVKAAGETTATVTAANTYDTAEPGVGSGPGDPPPGDPDPGPGDPPPGDPDPGPGDPAPGTRDPVSGYYTGEFDSINLSLARGFHRLVYEVTNYALSWPDGQTTMLTEAEYNAAGTATGYTDADGYTYFRDSTAANEVPWTFAFPDLPDFTFSSYASGIARQNSSDSTGGGARDPVSGYYAGEAGSGDLSFGRGFQRLVQSATGYAFYWPPSAEMSEQMIVLTEAEYDAAGTATGYTHADGYTYFRDPAAANEVPWIFADPNYPGSGTARYLAYTSGIARLSTLSPTGGGTAGETAATVTAANTYDTADPGVGSAPFHDVGLLTKSVNGAATQSFSRSLSGSTTVLTTTTVIDGVTHTVVETRGRSEQTLSIAYMPAA